MPRKYQPKEQQVVLAILIKSTTIKILSEKSITKDNRSYDKTLQFTQKNI